MSNSRRSPAEIDALIVVLIQRVAEGQSAKSCCRELGLAFPVAWRKLISPQFAPAYQEAFNMRAQMWAEELNDIGDDKSEDRTPDGKGNMAAVARSRLQSDNRKWLLSKLFPRQYGDSVALTGADGGPLEITWAQQPIIDGAMEVVEDTSQGRAPQVTDTRPK